MNFFYSYESNDNISETILHEVEILIFNCTALLVNLMLIRRGPNGSSVDNSIFFFSPNFNYYQISFPMNL